MNLVSNRLLYGVRKNWEKFLDFQKIVFFVLYQLALSIRGTLMVSICCGHKIAWVLVKIDPNHLGPILNWPKKSGSYSKIGTKTMVPPRQPHTLEVTTQTAMFWFPIKNFVPSTYIVTWVGNRGNISEIFDFSKCVCNHVSSPAPFLRFVV